MVHTVKHVVADLFHDENRFRDPCMMHIVVVVQFALYEKDILEIVVASIEKYMCCHCKQEKAL